MEEEINPGLRPDNEEQKYSEEEKHMLIRNYFVANKAVFPSLRSRIFIWALVLTLSGIFIIAYFEKTYSTIIFGAVVFLIGILLGYKWIIPYFIQKRGFSRVPNSEEMDIWLIEDIKTEIGI